MSGWSSGTDRIASALRALRERGQSETLGVALLTGIVVILVAVTGLFLFADFGADDEEQLLATVQGDINPTNITISHEGGDSFNTGDIEVVLSGDTNREWTLDHFNETEGNNGEFAPGDQWFTNKTGGAIVGEGRMLVVHRPTNTVLLDQPYSISQDGVTLLVESLPDNSLQSGNAQVYGESGGKLWNYSLRVTLDGTQYVNPNSSEIDYTLDISNVNGITDYYKNNGTIRVINDTGSGTVTANIPNVSTNPDITVDVLPPPKFSITNTNLTVLSQGAANPNGGPGLRPAGSGLSTQSGQFGTLAGPGTWVSDTVMLNATVENTGGAVGEQTLELVIEGGPGGGKNYSATETTTMTVSSGETRYAEFTHTVPKNAKHGYYTFAVNPEKGSPDQLTNWFDEPAEYNITDVRVNSTVEKGNPLSLDATINNTGSVSGDKTLRFSITGFSASGLEQTKQNVSVDGNYSSSSLPSNFTVDTGSISGLRGSFPATLEVVDNGTVEDTENFFVNVLQFDVSATAKSVDLFPNPGDITVEATVDPTVQELGTSITVPVELDESPLIQGSNSITKTVTFPASNNPSSKTVDFTVSPDYTNVVRFPTTYSLDVNETRTGSGDELDLTFEASDVVIDITSVQPSGPIGVNQTVTVDYTLKNNGNLPATVTPQLVTGNGDVADTDNTLTVDPDGSDKANEDLKLDDPGKLGYSNGETIDLNARALRAGTTNVLDADTDSVSIKQAPFFEVKGFTLKNPGTNYSVGDTVTLSATIENTGGKSDTQTLDLSTSPSSGLSEKNPGKTTNLGPGGTETVEFELDANSPGSYSVTVSTENDSDSVTVDVLQPPDFQITNTLLDKSATAGDNVSVTPEIENTGSVEGTQTVTFDIPGVGTATDTITLGPNDPPQDVPLEIDTAKSDTGTYTGTVSTENDSQTFAVDLGAPAVFDVSFTGSNSPVVEGNDLTVDIRVENTGGVQGTQDVTLTVGGGSLYQNTWSGITLDPNGVYTDTATIPTSDGDAGTYTAELTSDDTTATRDVTVETPANLVVRDVTASDVQAGQDITVYAEIENTGGRAASGQIVDMNIDTLGGNSQTVTINSGSQQNVSFDPVSTQFGDGGGTGNGETYDVTVDTGDDTGTGTVSVVPPPEGKIRIDSITSPGSIDIGDPIEFNVKLKNVGGQPIKGSDAEWDYLDLLDTNEDSLEGFVSANDIKNLAPGKTTQKTLTYSASTISSRYAPGDTVDWLVGLTYGNSTTIGTPGTTDINGDALSVSSVSVGQVRIPEGGSVDFDITYTIDNPNSVAVDATVDLNVCDNGCNTVKTETKSVAPGGETFTASNAGTVSESHLPANSGIKIEVDMQGGNKESDTLAVEAIRITSTSVSNTVHPYKTVSKSDITATVENKGSVSTSAYVHTGVDFDMETVLSNGNEDDTAYVDYLNPGDSASENLDINEGRYGTSDSVYIALSYDFSGSEFVEDDYGGYATFDIVNSFWSDSTPIGDVEIVDKGFGTGLIAETTVDNIDVVDPYNALDSSTGIRLDIEEADGGLNPTGNDVSCNEVSKFSSSVFTSIGDGAGGPELILVALHFQNSNGNLPAFETDSSTGLNSYFSDDGWGPSVGDGDPFFYLTPSGTQTAPGPGFPSNC